MKKQLFNILLCGLLTLPFMDVKADVVAEEQTTEGKDFWVTFLQADQGGADFSLDLAISSRYHCNVTISNPYTGYSETITVQPNLTANVNLDSSTNGAETSAARSRQKNSNKVCYAFLSETVDTCALHITSDSAISLFASNYQYASFDATNVLPTPSLQDEYIIQTYSPSDNDGDAKSQGSHFAIIATEDNTIVDYCPTAMTERYNKVFDDANIGYVLDPADSALLNYKVGVDTLHTPVLMKGQVFYVWTGKGKSGINADFSGTYVKARDGKEIAVFQGCPHTNIPHKIKLRDHIFSQAMPVHTWGNTFALTASNNRKRDIYRVLALNDGTTIYINGNLVHTFDFSIDKKHYWEFELGVAYGSLAAPTAEGTSCFLTTSCPCAVHQFMVSQQYDGDSKNNGDPAMLWINPIEQQINQITFTTYDSKKGETAHNVNIVTANPEGVKLDDVDISSSFEQVNGSDGKYWFARRSLGSATKSYTLRNDNGNFIAHVYGFTKNESYAYSAGGYVKSLAQSIYINGEEFSEDKENKLCGIDTVHFACKPDFLPDSIVWHFGDGTPDIKLVQDTTTTVPHFYKNGGDYDATCTIYRSSSNVCVGQSAKSVIRIKVTIGRYTFTIGQPDIPCPENGVQANGRIPYTSSINLKGDNVTVDFDDAAKAAGFTQSGLEIKDGYFELKIPATAEASVPYGINIHIKSDCGDKDTTMLFQLPIGNDVIAQRYTNVLGLTTDPRFEGLTLSDFQWYRTSDSTAIAGQVSAVLNMYDIPGEDFANDAFYVCYTINKGMTDERRTCACAKAFDPNTAEHQFETNPDSLLITATYSYIHGDKIFVNADYKGQTDIECYAQWITSSGNIYKDMKFTIPDGGCTIDTPDEAGLYLLRVSTDGKNRSFKFIIQ